VTVDDVCDRRFTMTTADLAAALETPIHAGGETKPFRELTIDDVQDRASELREAVGWGPTARVASVARAWEQLGQHMAAVEAQSVADLDRETVAEHLEELWVVPPGGSLL
jgi:hypothetical protein